MLFSRLTEYFGRIEGTSLRNTKTEILTEILKEAESSEVDKLVYLSLGGLRPAFDRLEFNLAEKMIVRAIAAAAGKSVVEMEAEYSKVGDLGELVSGIRKQELGTSNKTLNVTGVYEELEKIAKDSGMGSQERKVSKLANLIKHSDAQSAKYIVRMVAGKLRLGFSDKTVVDALSYMEKGNKEYSEVIDRAYQVRPDTGVLAKAVKEKGVVKAVESMDIEIGTPIVPALAQRLKTAKEMIEKMGRVYCEPKYDGTRVQIHFSRSEKLGNRNEELDIRQSSMFAESFGHDLEKEKFWVRTFTRNLDESSAMFPELQNIAGQIKADEVILDSEAVGYDPKSGKLVPFQLTITRKRKHGISDAQNSVPLKFFVFDIMYLNGQSLIHLPLSERRKILSETVVGNSTIVVDEYVETDDPDVLRAYHAKQLKGGLEGALVKQIDGQYMPGRTGFNWVKFKEAEDSRAKLSDTIDAVIMGYYTGKGKRQKFGLGAFLIGIRKEESGISEIVTLAKIGTGISDEQFGELFERLQMTKSEKPNASYNVPKILEPDVWVEPVIIVEVAADEITKSPTHSAGYALRFPRLVKFRDDKGVEQTTTMGEIKTMSGDYGLVDGPN